MTCCVCRHTSAEIMPELKKNMLNFGYGINFKYQGMLAHSFEGIYVVTTFILPTISDLKFLLNGFDKKCNYLNDNVVCDHNSKEYISNLKVYCRKIIPFVQFYKEQISSYNCTVHDILSNEISLILPNFPEARQENRSIIALLITGFIGLAYESISSYLHTRRQKPLYRAWVAMENKVNLQCNKLIHSEDSMLIYSIYKFRNFGKYN